MKKAKFVKMIAVVSLFTLATVNTLAVSFTDVKSTNWAFPALQDMQQRGIMLPNSKGEILPAKTMDYFEISDVIAKATGYVDVTTATNIDANFKAAILKNYENKKATLAKYSSKYANWDKRYDQQIAYILGKGYITEADLAKFVVKTTAGVEVKKTVTKQDLAVYSVRILQKENTAKQAYATTKTTGFSDEKIILEANRPHVAYLRAIGLVTGDETGAFKGNIAVTRALCAKMMSDVLNYKEKLDTVVTPPTHEVQTKSESVTVKKIMNKSASEYFVYYEKSGQTSWATIKNTTKVTDANNKTIDLSTMLNIALDLGATITKEIDNGTEYIASMKLEGNATSSVQTTLKGTLTRIGTYGDVTITLADDTTKTYMSDSNITVLLEGQNVPFESLKADDTVTLTIKNNLITKIDAKKGSSSSVGTLTEGEVTKKSIRSNGHVFTVIQNNKTVEWTVDDAAIITRNGKTASVYDIKLGDTLKVTQKSGVVTEVAATSKKSTIEGTITGIYIGGMSEVTVKTGTGIKTVIINDESELYDNNQREDIAIRDLRLGQEVEVLADSKEVISLVVQRGNSSVKYMGTIKSVGSGYEYIDVLVDYDPLTDNSKVIKRIKTPVTTDIVSNGKDQHRSVLETDMDVLVIYEYLDDSVPQKISILD